MPELSIALIEEAIRGNRRAMRELVDLLLPMVHYRAARALMRRSRRFLPATDVRRETEDLLQSVLLFLLKDGAQALLQWTPGHSVSLSSYVGLLAEREAMAILRSCRRDETAGEALDEPGEHAPPIEGRPHRREALLRLLDRVEALLSEPDLELFHLLVIEERPAEEICTLLDMTPEAVTATRGRLARIARGLATELVTDGAPVEDKSITGRG